LVISQQPTTIINETTKQIINQEINQNSRVDIDTKIIFKDNTPKPKPTPPVNNTKPKPGPVIVPVINDTKPEDTGGSNPFGEEEDQNCGGVACTDDEKEDYTLDDKDPGDYCNPCDKDPGDEGSQLPGNFGAIPMGPDQDEEEGKIDPKDEIGREPEPESEPEPEPEPEPESEPEEEEDNEEEDENDEGN
jgi:hypothetical protein